jgi:hypothetical protein
MSARSDGITFVFYKPHWLPRLDGWAWIGVGCIGLVLVLLLATRLSTSPTGILSEFAQPSILDVSGAWTGYLYIEGYEDVHHSWSLALQQDGDVVTGTSMIQTNYVFTINNFGIANYRPIPTSTAAMTIRGRVDAANQRVSLQEIELIATDVSPDVVGWCRKQGELVVNVSIMTAVSMAAEACGKVNAVLIRRA